MFNVYKLWLWAAILLICGTFTTIGVYNYRTKKELLEKLEIAEMNNIALMRTNLVYNTNMNDLQAVNDSLSKRLTKAMSDLKIKPKKVKEVITTTQLVKVSDSIVFKDTVFVKDLKLDTVLGDKLTNVRLQLQHPNKLSYSFEINNHQDIMTEEYKAHLNPKDWFWNLFRKKKTFVRIWVVNDNPNITTSETKIIHLNDK